MGQCPDGPYRNIHEANFNRSTKDRQIVDSKNHNNQQKKCSLLKRNTMVYYVYLDYKMEWHYNNKRIHPKLKMIPFNSKIY
jgi:hypothetical protein